MGESSAVYVYALWLKAFTNTDFENTSFSGEPTKDVVTINEITVRATNTGSSIQTLVDDNGNKYIKIGVAGSDAILLLQSDEYNLTNMSSTSISYQMDLRSIDGVNITNTSIKIASSGGTYGQLSIANVDPETGDVTLANSTEVIGNVLTSDVTVRLVVNFAEGKAYAYDENGNVLSSSTLTVPVTSVSSLAEWQKVARNYLLYIYFYRSNSSAADPAALGIDNVIIAEGNMFA